MSYYGYKCFTCNSQFSPDKIEKRSLYLCPKCGTAKKNEPLNGVLLIEYDYHELSKRLSRKAFLDFIPGQFWMYPNLWPLNFKGSSKNFSLKNIDSDLLNHLKLSSSPVSGCQLNGNTVLLLDDTRNPTLSFKDRASILVALKAIQMGYTVIAAASTGNAGSSLAGICARAGLKSHLFLPAAIPSAKLIQIQSYGGETHLIKGDYDEAFDLCLEVSSAKGWFNRNTAYNPLTIEGKKSAAYDIFISLRGNVPDIIFVPVGDGVILSGLYKGFWELLQLGWLERIPRLIGIQAEGSDALLRYMKTGRFIYRPAHTIADSISAGAPRNLFMAADAIKRSGGTVLSVSDSQILKAQKLLALQTGYLVEPSSAAGYAGYHKFCSTDQIAPKEKVLLMMTGHGLKDLSALQKWNKSSKTFTQSQWKEHFKL